MRAKDQRAALRRGGLFLLGAALLAPVVCGQRAPVQRVLSFEQSEVERALRELRAFSEADLPSLEGFVDAPAEVIEHCRQPRYLFQIELSRPAREQTRVIVRVRITTWFAGPDAAHAGYRTLPSSGRLEKDLLDRLEERLKKTVWTLPEQGAAAPPTAGQPPTEGPGRPRTFEREVARLRPAPPSADTSSAPASPDSLRAEISSTRRQREAMEKEAQELRAVIQRLTDLSRSAPGREGKAVVRAALAPVREQPAESARLLFSADAQDQFEMLERRGSWVRVRLAGDAQGWLRGPDLEAEDGPAGAVGIGVAAQGNAFFGVAREDVFPFSGEWSELQGKQALFVFAQPLVEIPAALLGSTQLAFAQQVFRERYFAATHSPQPYAGIVVIFLGAKGGVAGATLQAIRPWAEGSLAEAAFLKRCSLDPPEAFRDAKRP
jgi:hypothetical protein